MTGQFPHNWLNSEGESNADTIIAMESVNLINPNHGHKQGEQAN